EFPAGNAHLAVVLESVRIGIIELHDANVRPAARLDRDHLALVHAIAASIGRRPAIRDEVSLSRAVRRDVLTASQCWRAAVIGSSHTLGVARPRYRPATRHCRIPWHVVQ